MAVAPTGAIYKALEFDGVSSRTYGVYITGEAVYNAPERDVEMITIPGRSGSFALDNGRFENITVTYPAGIFAETEAEFREAISEFRNFLCSRKGYVRLQDEYNPDEYRMAVYKSGLEVEPVMLKAGEFEITFDCKPQRWLTSGETTIDVTSGDTITNPTLFEASPMLKMEGYGSIDWGAGVITVNNAAIGDAIVSKSQMRSYYSLSWDIDSSLANVGDPLTVEACSVSEQEVFTDSGAVNSYTYSTTGDPIVTMRTLYNSYMNIGRVLFTIKTKSLLFTYGNSGTETCTLSCSCAVAGHGTQTFTATFTLTYDGDVTFTLSLSVVTSAALNYRFNAESGYVKSGDVILTSSKPSLGNPLYIDLDMGEAYKYESGQAVFVNNGIILPADLPKLTVGANTITFDNTITDLKVIPRWWKI